MDSGVRSTYKGLVIIRAADELISLLDSESKKNDGRKSEGRCIDEEDKCEAEIYYKVISVLHKTVGKIDAIEKWS